MAAVQDTVCGLCLEHFKVKDVVSEFCHAPPHRFHFDCFVNGYVPGAKKVAVAGNLIKCPTCRQQRPVSEAHTFFLLQDRLAPATDFPDWEWWLPTMPPTPPTLAHNLVVLEGEADDIPTEIIDPDVEVLYANGNHLPPHQEEVQNAPLPEEPQSGGPERNVVGYQEPELLEPIDVYYEPGIRGVVPYGFDYSQALPVGDEEYAANDNVFFPFSSSDEEEEDFEEE